MLICSALPWANFCGRLQTNTTLTATVPGLAIHIATQMATSLLKRGTSSRSYSGLCVKTASVQGCHELAREIKAAAYQGALFIG